MRNSLFNPRSEMTRILFSDVICTTIQCGSIIFNQTKIICWIHVTLTMFIKRFSVIAGNDNCDGEKRFHQEENVYIVQVLKSYKKKS